MTTKITASMLAPGAVTVTPSAISDQSNISTGYLDLPAGTTAERPVTPVDGMFRYNTTTYAVEAYMRGSWIVVGSNPVDIPTEYLVVAGGGAGGGNGGGGGGAGGVLYSSNTTFQTNIIYTVTVGAGGTYSASNAPGGYGSNSSIVGALFGSASVTATGGGGGASRSGTNATNGGSGGGGGDALDSATYGPGTGIVGPPRQGYNGGISGANNGGAGGGGAGAAASNSSGGNPTAGGAGTSTYSALLLAASAGVNSSGTYYIAGGGAGGRCPGLGSQTAAGGLGGGGASVAQTGPSISGTANTGGGGGGGGVSGASGGSGVVIIRYADTYQAATSTTGSPTVTVAGGYRIYKFTGSGSITI